MKKVSYRGHKEVVFLAFFRLKVKGQFPVRRRRRDEINFPPSERTMFMEHTMHITVAKDRKNGGIMACRQLTAREKFLRWLLGDPVKLTVIVPGDSVDEVAIFKKSEVIGNDDIPK